MRVAVCAGAVVGVPVQKEMSVLLVRRWRPSSREGLNEKPGSLSPSVTEKKS